MVINNSYNLKKDIESFMEANSITIDDFSEESKISKRTIYNIFNDKNVDLNTIENIYSYMFNSGYRMNSIKEEILKESTENIVLFHGSKFGLNQIDVHGARQNCDFGNGFYLGETYSQALSFVFENKDSSIYSFECDLKELNILEFKTTLEWMISICYYRGTIKEYQDNDKVLNIISKIEKADVIIAPIADNKMFYIMSLFTNGDINADVALHSLSASNLGKQYVFKTNRALEKLKFKEHYYVSIPERNNEVLKLNERILQIETKLKMSKREFKDGLYIEEIFK